MNGNISAYELLTRISEAARQSFSGFPGASVFVAEDPANAVDIMARIGSGQSAVVFFYQGDSNYSDEPFDVLVEGKIKVCIIQNRGLKIQNGENVPMAIAAADAFRIWANQQEFDFLADGTLLYQGMQPIQIESGQFLHGYALEFSARYPAPIKGENE